jgi:protein-S-isoprenylcysteine O-methyltransferase Ste14
LLGKFRIDRKPLRWWLIGAGMLTIHLDPARQLTGTVLVLAGAVLHFVSKGYLRQSKRYIGQSQSLTMRGPYRFTRNPFYLANLIAEIGLLIVIGSWPLAVIYLTVWTWVYRKQILAEEATLESLAGERLCSYRDRVPRLLPRTHEKGISPIIWKSMATIDQ